MARVSGDEKFLVKTDFIGLFNFVHVILYATV